jgi:hypothetical protein
MFSPFLLTQIAPTAAAAILLHIDSFHELAFLHKLKGK